MNKHKVEEIFDLIEKMSDDIYDWMQTARMEGMEVSEEGYEESRELLEKAGAILQEWKSR